MSDIRLQRIKGGSYYTTGAFAVGVYRYNNNVILIDSGSDENTAKKLDLAIGLTVTAIINTHCHPDHSGGNAYFQKKYPNIKIYSTYDEKFFIEDPKWAARCFCGNAAPFAELKHKLITSQKKSVITDIVSYNDEILIIDNQHLKIVTLPGHTPGSIGIITPDNVLYSGDALFGVATLAKHPVLFYTDLADTLATFKKLITLDVHACVLYHGGMIHNLIDLVQQHQERVIQIKDFILKIVLQQQCSVDLLTQQVMQHYKINGNIISFTLTQTIVQAYLAQLESEKAICVIVQDGLLQIKGIR